MCLLHSAGSSQYSQQQAGYQQGTAPQQAGYQQQYPNQPGYPGQPQGYGEGRLRARSAGACDALFRDGFQCPEEPPGSLWGFCMRFPGCCAV